MAVLGLSVAVAKFAEKIELGVGLVCERLAEELWNKITMRTPVDTGRARASWMMSTGEPRAIVPQVSTKSTGKNSKNSAPPEDPKAPFPTDVEIDGNAPIYIVSAVEYIEYLEGGSSQQAVNGMVAISVIEVEAEMQQWLDKIAKQLE